MHASSGNYTQIDSDTPSSPFSCSLVCAASDTSSSFVITARLMHWFAVSTLLIEVTAYLLNLLFSCYELVQIWNGVTLLL